MSETSAIQVGGTPSAATGEHGIAGLSPDALLGLLQTRLDGLDGGIGSYLGAIQRATADSDGLSREIEALQAIQQALTGLGGDDTKKRPLSEITVVWPDPATGAPVSMTADALLELVPVSNLNVDPEAEMPEVSLEMVNRAVDELQTRQRRIGSDNEIQMVNLQALMHQRTESISIVTSLLRGMHESSQEIARNLR